MSYTLGHFLRDVEQGITANQLSKVLSINPEINGLIPKLQPQIQGMSSELMMKKIEEQHYFNGDWPSFETMLQSYLLFVRDFNPWSILESIDLMIKFYESLSVSLNNLQFNSKLLLLQYESTNLIVPLARLVDMKMMKINNRVNDYPRLSHVSTILLKALNNLRSDPDLNLPSNRNKISVIMHTSITLCRTYIAIDSTMLCNNVFSNINILSLDKSLISKKQLIQYRIQLGKFHLLQSNYLLAYNHFNWCYLNCYFQTPRKIILAILKYLVPCGLLVGKIPNTEYLESKLGSQDSFITMYKSLIQHYKAGDIYNFSMLVSHYETYFLELGFLIGFLQRMRLILLRNLLLNVYKNTRSKNLLFSDVKIGLQLSLQPESSYQNFDSVNKWFYPLISNHNEQQQLQQNSFIISDAFVENVLASLIDGNLMKAKLTTGRTIILSKTGSFPKVYDIYKIIYPATTKEKWLY